jgi:hypothetical protein
MANAFFAAGICHGKCSIGSWQKLEIIKLRKN